MSNKKLFPLDKNIPMMKKIHCKDHGTTTITINHATLEHLEEFGYLAQKKIQSI
jgi:hypothetical protein